VLDRDDVLGDLQVGGLRFKSIEQANIRVRIYGATVLLTADSRTVSSRKGEDIRAHVRLLAVYVSDGKRLRLAHFQSVSLPG
jgi:hypothetical protein